jgi:hypothetical protein
MKTSAVKPFSGAKWSPADVCAFASLLCVITIGAAESAVPESPPRVSVADVLGPLAENRFQILAGVDSEAVSAFIASVEAVE